MSKTNKRQLHCFQRIASVQVLSFNCLHFYKKNPFQTKTNFFASCLGDSIQITACFYSVISRRYNSFSLKIEENLIFHAKNCDVKINTRDLFNYDLT